MRLIASLLLLLGAMVLGGSECDAPLAPIPCTSDEDCDAECVAACAESGREVEMSACDANMFCECLCMPAGSGGSGGSGEAGAGG